MQWYEVEACLNGLDSKYKISWEQTRFVSYMVAQVNSTKQLKPTDILSFTWDNTESYKDTAISNEDIERLKQKANNIINTL